MLSEHHVSADGYLPSPIPVAAAFAAVTSTDPDLGGRAAGEPLRPAPAGRGDRRPRPPVRRPGELHARARLPARGVRPVRRRRGRPAAATSRTGSAGCSTPGPTVTVTPGPYSQPHPMLFYGGGSVGRRQARGPPRPALPAAGRRPRAQGGLRGRVPRPGSRARLHAARPGRSGQRLLRRGPGPVLGRARPPPARRRPGVRRLAGDRHVVVRPRRLGVGRGDAGRRRLRGAHRRRADREVPGRRDPAGHQPTRPAAGCRPSRRGSRCASSARRCCRCAVRPRTEPPCSERWSRTRR